MFRRRLQLIESYEVIGQPVVSASGLTYVPWIDQAVQPYGASRLPHGTGTGLAGARIASPAEPDLPAADVA